NRTFGGNSGRGGFDARRYNARPEIAYEIPSFGGGVYCAADTVVTFDNCTITDNIAAKPSGTYYLDPYLGYGGGICAEDSAKVILNNCLISDNEASIGGGIQWADETQLIITDCNVVDNDAFHGAGLHSVKNLNALSTITNTFIGRNMATDQPEPIVVDGQGNDFIPPEQVTIPNQGGGYYCSSTIVDILDSTFTENQASASGGGIAFNGSDQNVAFDPLLHNSLITRNTAGRDGGGISVKWY
ncbi:unnamed protein product, partial [marine sediment metagenome]